MRSRTLILLRHGRTAWNLVGRAQGHADIELDDIGHAQAAVAASYLATLEVAALWSSDLARARQTAEYVEKHTGLAARYDERLREYDVGTRQGLTMPEFAETFPAEYDAWRRGDEMLRVAGAESTSDVVDRMLPALRECLAALAPGETGVVVTHGACLKVGLCALLGWPQTQATSLQGIGNCAWVVLSELEDGGRLRLDTYNERVDAPGEGTRDL